MNNLDLAARRIARLEAAVDKLDAGNRTAFGRRLGYKDGAFVRQMLSGARPISEKTVLQIESLHGMGGWFSHDQAGSESEKASARKHVLAEPSSQYGASPRETVEAWPFARIPEEQVRALKPEDIARLEGVLAAAILNLQIPVKVGPKPSTAASALAASMDVADAFPMQPLEAPPQQFDGVRPSYGLGESRSTRPLISTAREVVTNVSAGHHAANDDFEAVCELREVRLAAGVEGIEVLNEAKSGELMFRRSFLKRHGADGGRGVVVYAEGESMRPLIRDGAAMLLVPASGLSLRDVAAGGVWAINYDGKMLVKTIVRPPGGMWVARSLNPAFPDILLETGVDVRVIGPIVWAGAEIQSGITVR